MSSPTGSPRSELHAVSVLVVDDELFSRTVIRQGLLNAGCGRVDVATDGKHALSVLFQADRHYDAIISDYRMEEMDGIELLRRIRCGARGVSRDIVFGILTGYSDKDTIGLAFNLDVDFFVSKPPTIDGLKARLTKALNTERPIKLPKVYAKIAEENPRLTRPPGQTDRQSGGAGAEPEQPDVRPSSKIVIGAGKPVQTKSTENTGPKLVRKITDVMAGAVLAEDLRTAGGTLILQSGFTLTPALVERLRSLSEVDSGVREISILPPDSDES